MASPAVHVTLTEAEMKLLQTLVYQECGMFFDERRAHFLQDRVNRRIKETGLDGFFNYYKLLTGPKSRGEIAALVDNLTINETSFFRNKPQLELFHKITMDEILHRKHQRRDWSLKVWSAGCSTGQEPYTMAMLICDALAFYNLRNPLPIETPSPKPLVPAPWRVEVLASDISYRVLRTAQEGSYSETQMEPVDYSYRLRYFDKINDRYVVKKALMEFIHFDFHNLKTEFLPQHNDVIFCRNVMIYFDEAEQRRLISKFHRCLKPDGYLFVGHAESLFGLSDKFRMVHVNNGTAYQRIEA